MAGTKIKKTDWKFPNGYIAKKYGISTRLVNYYRNRDSDIIAPASMAEYALNRAKARNPEYTIKNKTIWNVLKELARYYPADYQVSYPQIENLFKNHGTRPRPQTNKPQSPWIKANVADLMKGTLKDKARELGIRQYELQYLRAKGLRYVTK